MPVSYVPNATRGSVDPKFQRTDANFTNAANTLESVPVVGSMLSGAARGIDPAGIAREELRLAEQGNNSGAIQGSDQWLQWLRAGAQNTNRGTTYDPSMAARNTSALQALYQQMMGQANGPSVTARQGQQAMGQNLQAALASRGGNAAVAQRAQAAAMQMAPQVAQAVSAEQAQGITNAQGLATGLRQRQLQAADAQAQSAVQNRGMDDALRRFYISQGANLANRQDAAAIDRYKLLKRLEQQNLGEGSDASGQAGGLIGMILSLFA